MMDRLFLRIIAITINQKSFYSEPDCTDNLLQDRSYINSNVHAQLTVIGFVNYTIMRRGL